MKKLLIGLAVVGLVAVGAAVTLRMTVQPKGVEPIELLISLTCDTHGRLEPCGCFSGQLGGLSRIDSLLGEGDPEREIRVDAGDAIEGIEDYNVIEYRYILQAYKGMNFDALNVGHLLSQLPADAIAAVAAEAPVPLISANLKHKTTGELLLKPYRVVKRGAYRIGIVGVVDPQRDEGEFGEQVVVAKMATALGNIMPELKAKADVIILLAFTDEIGMAALAREFYELDLILGGNVAQPSQELAQENESLILFTTNQARALAQLGVVIDPEFKVRASGHNIRLVLENVPESERVLALADAYRQEVRDTKLKVDDPERLTENLVPGVVAEAHFTDTAACLSCHLDAMKSWVHSRHSKAFGALERKQSASDPSCLGCHTIGFGTATGYRRVMGKEKMIGVGCESCHGPGSAHVAYRTGQSTTPFTFRPLGAGDCKQCHHGEFSRPFEWEKWWPPVKHSLDVKQETP